MTLYANENERVFCLTTVVNIFEDPSVINSHAGFVRGTLDN
jgi:hypothetical protein